MSEINNEESEPDLWNMALAELRSNPELLMLSVRTRLKLETVKSQKELDEATMQVYNMSVQATETLQLVHDAIASMNNTLKVIESERKEARRLEKEAQEKMQEAKDFEKELKVKGLGMAWKAGIAVVGIISLAIAIFT